MVMEGCQKPGLEPKAGLGSSKVSQLCPAKVLRSTRLTEAGGRPGATATRNLK